MFPNFNGGKLSINPGLLQIPVPPPPAATNFLLQQNGFAILQQNGEAILLQPNNP